MIGSVLLDFLYLVCAYVLRMGDGKRIYIISEILTFITAIDVLYCAACNYFWHIFTNYHKWLIYLLFVPQSNWSSHINLPLPIEALLWLPSPSWRAKAWQKPDNSNCLSCIKTLISYITERNSLAGDAVPDVPQDITGPPGCQDTIHYLLGCSEHSSLLD